MEDYKVQLERGESIDKSRITLQLDPRLSPREVMDIYSKARRELLGFGYYRALSEKHKTLAAFSRETSHIRPNRVRMDQWNALHPEWVYERESNFTRDMKLAVVHEVHGHKMPGKPSFVGGGGTHAEDSVGPVKEDEVSA